MPSAGLRKSLTLTLSHGKAMLCIKGDCAFVMRVIYEHMCSVLLEIGFWESSGEAVALRPAFFGSRRTVTRGVVEARS